MNDLMQHLIPALVTVVTMLHPSPTIEVQVITRLFRPKGELVAIVFAFLQASHAMEPPGIVQPKRGTIVGRFALQRTSYLAISFCEIELFLLNLK
jgi:hypothetical protein